MEFRKTHILTYKDGDGKKHRLRVRIMNTQTNTRTVIAGRPGAEYIIVSVPKTSLKEIPTINA